MDHALVPDEGDVDARGGGPLGEAHGVVEERLAGADLDVQRREAAQVGEQRRRRRRGRLGAGEVARREICAASSTWVRADIQM